VELYLHCHVLHGKMKHMDSCPYRASRWCALTWYDGHWEDEVSDGGVQCLAKGGEK
jgi:hypothetical protein